MILALFRQEDRLTEALHQLRTADIGPLETYTPAPVQSEAVFSPIPLIILFAALIGAATSLGLQTWSYTIAFPFPIGGRPQFAWPSFLPTVFENAILVAIATGFLAFMVINRMPRLYEPVDDADVMRDATRDGWIVAVQSRDSDMLSKARAILRDLNPARIEELDA